MHINKPFPRLTHSSLSLCARVIRDDGRGGRGCLQRVCVSSVFAAAPPLRDEVAWNRAREQGECPPQLHAPPARPVGEMGKVKEREGEGREGSRARMVWFIVWRTADRPTERASNVNGGRKEGRTPLKRWPHHWARNRLRRSLFVDVAAASWHARVSSLILH